MNKSCYLIGSTLILALTALARADSAAPRCGCEKGYYEKVITVFKPVCTDEKVPTIVKKCFYRDEMKPVKIVVMVPKECTVRRPKVVQVPHEVVLHKCRKVPVKLMDPNTGCSIITYRDEPYTETCMQTKAQLIIENVKVYRNVPEERVVMQPCKVLDWREETVMEIRKKCVMVPCQKTIRVPCPPPGPNYSQEVPLSPSRPLPLAPAPLPPAPLPN